MAFVVILALIVLVLLAVVVSYNRFVSQRNLVRSSWANIDTELKRRYDLIPNLVETVKGYAAHERQTLEAVVQARNSAIAAQTPAEQAQAENVLTGALKSIFALAEAYPDLKANQSFLELQEELTATEGRIAYARQLYNDSVLTYNNTIQVFPRNVLAGMFNFERREFFEAGGEERGPVRVQF